MKRYEHCESGGNQDSVSHQFRFTWDFRRIKVNSWQSMSYEDWRHYCMSLKTVFNQYPEVKWSCISFEFHVTCNNLHWVIDLMLQHRNRVLSDLSSIHHWVAGRGHVAITLNELLEIT